MGKDVTKKTAKKDAYFESGVFDVSEAQKHQEDKNRRKRKFEDKKKDYRREDKWK